MLFILRYSSVQMTIRLLAFHPEALPCRQSIFLHLQMLHSLTTTHSHGLVQSLHLHGTLYGGYVSLRFDHISFLSVSLQIEVFLFPDIDFANLQKKLYVNHCLLLQRRKSTEQSTRQGFSRKYPHPAAAGDPFSVIVDYKTDTLF